PVSRRRRARRRRRPPRQRRRRSSRSPSGSSSRRPAWTRGCSASRVSSAWPVERSCSAARSPRTEANRGSDQLMAFPRAQAAGRTGWGLPFRFRLFSKRKIGFVGGLALVIGLVLVVDAVITVVWEDPLTAVFTQQEQKQLRKKLAAAEAAPLPPTTLALVKQAGTPQKRMAVLAAHTRTTTAAGDPLGRIAIPRIGSNFVFVSGTGTDS